MPRDGSGNYTRPAGQPVSSGTVIDASVFNTLTSDLATALTGSMPRDGQAPPTANLPMGGFRLTGLGNGSAAADSVTLEQAQGAAAQWLTSIAGTDNAVEGAASPAITAYAAGQTFRFVPASTNTGATTLQIGALAAQNVFAFGAACVGGELVAGVPVTVVHDGTRFHAINPQGFQGKIVVPGTILPFAGVSVPSSYLNCNGANVSRATYADLFAAIGTTWGVGDNVTTFGLPDLRRRVAVGSGGTGTGTLGNAVGNTGGAETNAHTHTIAHTHTGTTSDGSSSIANATIQNVSSFSLSSHTHTFTTGAASSANSGGASSGNIMQPSAVVNYIIKV